MKPRNLKLIGLTMLGLASLHPQSASAEMARIRCECGHWLSHSHHQPRDWIQEGEVIFSAETDNESYWGIGKKLCQKKLHRLGIEVAGCEFAN